MRKLSAKEFFAIIFVIIFLIMAVVLVQRNFKDNEDSSIESHDCYAHMWLSYQEKFMFNHYYNIPLNEDHSICVSESSNLEFLGDGWVMLRMIDETVLFVRSENYFIKLKPIRNVKSQRQRRS